MGEPPGRGTGPRCWAGRAGFKATCAPRRASSAGARVSSRQRCVPCREPRPEAQNNPLTQQFGKHGSLCLLAWARALRRDRLPGLGSGNQPWKETIHIKAIVEGRIIKQTHSEMSRSPSSMSLKSTYTNCTFWKVLRIGTETYCVMWFVQSLVLHSTLSPHPVSRPWWGWMHSRALHVPADGWVIDSNDGVIGGFHQFAVVGRRLKVLINLRRLK